MTERPWHRHLPSPDHEWFPADLARFGLSAAFVRHWAAEPGRDQLFDDVRGWVTRGELDEMTAAAAGALHASGVAPGDRVLTSAGSSIDLVVAHLGAVRLGAIVVPVHTGYTRRELAHVLDDARPVVALLDDPSRTAEAAPSLPVIEPHRLTSMPTGADRPLLDRADPDDVAMLPYTSGTTGRPKGVALSHRNLLAGALAVATAWRWTADDRLVLALPLFHMHGLGVGVHGTLVVGASAVILSGFSPESVLDAVRTHDATLFFGVPTMYQRLVGHPRVAELARLRLCVSGSAPLAAELHEAVAAATGQAVVERYGMTETVMNLSNPHDGERRPGAVGLPLPGVEARLDGTTDRGEGEIQLRGPNVFGGYWNRPEATAEAFTEDGWFRTGDVARIDPDGYWRIVGRTKELIISGGYNVFPREVEDALVEHPDVAEAAVAGTPDPEWGEVVTALVVAVPGATLDTDELGAHCAERLVDYKRPRRLHVVEALPRNALGKLVRPAVTAAAIERAED